MTDDHYPLGQIFETFLTRHNFAGPNLLSQGKIAVAVSGGPDSMALLAVACEYAKKHNIYLHALTVDHGLRLDAKGEADMVGEWVTAQKSKLFHHDILTWEGGKPDSGIMEAARTARYDLMAKYCGAHNIPVLFVAHHQDDQAETFLIRLSKGSGLDGLVAMQEVRNFNEDLKILRPFLQTSKSELVEYCDSNGIPFASDPSNENVNYLRPRLRQSMAVLAEEGLTAKRLAVTASRLNRARRALEDITDSAYHACLLTQTAEDQSFDWLKLQACPEEIAFRVVQAAIENLREGADYNIRMDRLESLFESLWQDPQSFKPRTLGGFVISLHKKPQFVLVIEKEHK